MALSYESPSGEADPTKMEALRKTIADLLERVINPWCAICESRSFIYEDEVTRFRTLAEAEPELRAMEEGQRRTAEFLKASRN
jgi:hypothetical protein